MRFAIYDRAASVGGQGVAWFKFERDADAYLYTMRNYYPSLVKVVLADVLV